ncbi:hypothetical protein ARMSODRAFT_124694 [Armillaria solidipes]|uniref:Uncharacterized protein n=1 Tax=Armillaria solidipes TaxID=1076256 RepID=A0A2H3C1T6_9AGAR|nr:hypothetical protein ARMSODRAFT_124694 [Armillaria solidipes]
MSASEDTVANMFGHGLALGTTCQDHPRVRHRTHIMEHLLAGLCEVGRIIGRCASMSERVCISPCLLHCLCCVLGHHRKNCCAIHGLRHPFLRCWYAEEQASSCVLSGCITDRLSLLLFPDCLYLLSALFSPCRKFRSDVLLLALPLRGFDIGLNTL